MSESLIHTNVFNPQLDITQDRQSYRLVSGFYGREGLRTLVNASQGVEPANDLSSIDAHFYNKFAEHFGVESKNDSIFYRRQLENANHAVLGYISTVFGKEWIDRIGLNNQIGVPFALPSDHLRQLAYPGVAPKVRFENQRQLGLAAISAELYSREIKNQLGGQLAKVQKYIDRSGLYEGLEGENQTVPIRTYNNNYTNETVYVEGVDLLSNLPVDFSANSYHAKLHDFQMRKVTRNGYVMTQIREKSPAAAINKAVVKGMLQNGNINAQKDVQDVIGMMNVCLGDDSSVESLIQAHKEIFESIPGYAGQRSKNNTGTNRGQSEQFRFFRELIQFENMPVPIEIIYTTMKDYLNGQLDIRQAHTLFEVKRLMTLLPLYFPKHLYPYDLESVGHTNMQLIEAHLLNTRRTTKSLYNEDLTLT